MVGVIIAIPILVGIALYIPPVQNYVVDKVCASVSKSTGMKINVGHILLKFPLDLKVDDVKVLQASGDTMALVGEAKVRIALLPLFKGDIALREFEGEDVFFQLGNRDSTLWLRAQVTQANIGPGQINLSKGDIDVDRAEVDGARVMLALKDTTEVSPKDTTQSKPFSIHAGLIRLSDVQYQMFLPPTIDTLSTYVANATLREGVVNIGKRRISANSLSVNGVNARYIHPHAAESSNSELPKEPRETANDSPSEMWLIEADTLSLDASYALYAANGATPLPGLDMNYLEVKDTQILIEKFRNQGSYITVPLKRLSTSERCGLTLIASGTFCMDSAGMQANDFKILTNRSHLYFNAAMGLGSLTDYPPVPLSLIANGSISANDVELAVPLLKPIIDALPQPRELLIDIDAQGTTADLDVEKVSLQMPGTLTLSMSGHIINVLNFDKLGGKMTINGKVRDPRALKKTLTQLKIDPSIQIPALTLSGVIDYNPGNIDAKVTLKTGQGELLASGKWNASREKYSANIRLSQFPIQSFITASGIGTISATVKVDGKGYNPLKNSMMLHAEVDVANIELKGAVYKDIFLKADLEQGRAFARLTSTNPGANIDLTLNANAESGIVNGTLNGDIYDLNLYNLGIMNSPCDGKVTISASGQYNPSAKGFSVKANLENLNWLVDSMQFSTPSIVVSAMTDTANTALQISNEDLYADLIVYAPLDSLMAKVDNINKVIKEQIVEHRANVEQLQRAIPRLDGYISMGPDNLAARYMADRGISWDEFKLSISNDSLIHLSVDATGIDINGTNIDAANIQINQHGKYLIYNGGMTNGPGKLEEWANVDLRGFIADDKFSVFADQHNLKGQQGYRLGAVATMADSIVSLKLVPFDPTIAYQKWKLNENNFLSVNLNNYQIKADISLSNATSSIRLYTRETQDKTEGSSPEELAVSIKDVQLGDWVSISPFAPQMSGLVSAEAAIHTINKDLVGNAEVSLQNFIYDRQRVGDFKVDLNVTQNPKTKTLIADANVWVNGKKTMTANGALNDSTRPSPFLLDFSMIHFPLEVANPFLPKDLVSLRGSLNGTMKISGGATSPVFDGFLQFDSAAVKVVILGSEFNFSNEKIPVDSNLVSFNKFAINTLNENPLTIDGTADISHLSNVGLNINLNGTDMLVVNSNRARGGADIYGQGYVSLDASAKGNMRFLMCNADMALLSGSNVTYVLSGGTEALANKSNNDMVHFVNFADSLSVADIDSVAPSMNLLLNATLNIQNNTTINVDLSTDGKNRASIMGSGEFDFSMTPQNNGRLTGRYTIDGGYVRYTPPLMSEKNFKFESGSWVGFNGDISNPGFNIKAIDELKANVTPEGGGNSRLVDFDVIVSITGSLSNMHVVFDLTCDDDITIQNELSSMSADQRANQAMNMLLYNTYTGPGSKANSNLTGNPLYSFLASQLNSLASNYIKGVDLSFGINQYDQTLNGSTSTATSYSYQISKSLLNNRIRIVVGGNYTADSNTEENIAETLLNDVSFEYLLNRSGSMYIRVFRHTGYESILEGEITSTGVGFVYKRNLDSLRDIFKPSRKKTKVTINP